MRKVISLRKMKESDRQKPNFCSILIFRRLACSIDPWSQRRQPSRYFFKISRIRRSLPGLFYRSAQAEVSLI